MTKMVRLLFEGSEEMCEFVAYFLRKAKIKTEIVPIVHSSKDEMSRMLGFEFAKGWNPTHTLRVQEDRLEDADYITHHLPEYNWYKKRPKKIDVSRDIFSQRYGVK